MIECRKSDSGFGIEGVVINYGEVTSRTRFGNEKILSGAFGAVEQSDVVLNIQHDRTQPLARTGKGGLTLIDSPKELRAKVDFPNTRAAADTYEMVKKEILRGFSVEMIVDSERMENDVRVVTGARLVGLGLVDTPAYQLSKASTQARIMPLWAL